MSRPAIPKAAMRMPQARLPDQPEWVQLRRDFVEVGSDFEIPDNALSARKNGRVFVWADVAYETPSKSNRNGGTWIIPVTKSHFKYLQWS